MNQPKKKMDAAIVRKMDVDIDPEFKAQVLPMLPRDESHMIDRITSIVPDGGRYGRGYISAEYDIDSSSWMFASHRKNPSMPGSLGVDGLCQLLCFYLRWQGYPCTCRTMSPGLVRYLAEVTPDYPTIEYQIHIQTIELGDRPFLIADGEIRTEDGLATAVSGLMVGISTDVNTEKRSKKKEFVGLRSLCPPKKYTHKLLVVVCKKHSH